MKLIIGKKYKVKLWEKMEKQYGLKNTGSINVPGAFTREMSFWCGKYVTIARCGDTGLYYIKESNFVWSPQMFELEDSIEYWLEMRNREERMEV